MPISAQELEKLSVSSLEFYERNKPIDQVGTATPWLKKLGESAKKLTGGRQNIVTSLRKSNPRTMGWAYGETPVQFNLLDTAINVQFAWKRCVDGWRISHDTLFNNGITVTESSDGKSAKLTADEKVQLFNLMEEEASAFYDGFLESLDYDLLRDGTASADAPVGLDALVSLTPTTGTVGGINRANAAYWRNNADTGIVASNPGDLAEAMEKQWRLCSKFGGSNAGNPNFILCGEDFLDAYRKYAISITQNAEASAIKRIEAGTGTGNDSGLFFKGIPLIAHPRFADLDADESPTVPWAKRCYMLNMNRIKLWDGGMMITRPQRPHDVLSLYQMATRRVCLTMNQANAHSVMSIA